MEDLDCEPFVTSNREWEPDFAPRTHTLKKTFTNNKRVEEEAIINNDTYRLEFSNDKNIASFDKTQKTLGYGNINLFTSFAKIIKYTCKDLWTNIVEREYRYDSNNILGLQTTDNVKLALDKYQEGIINKVPLHNV